LLAIEAANRECFVPDDFLRQDGLDVNPASPLDLEMIMSGISHGHIVAFPDAADMHVFRTTVAFSQHFVA
jgi:hypothetical protein